MRLLLALVIVLTLGTFGCTSSSIIQEDGVSESKTLEDSLSIVSKIDSSEVTEEKTTSAVPHYTPPTSTIIERWYPCKLIFENTDFVLEGEISNTDKGWVFRDIQGRQIVNLESGIEIDHLILERIDILREGLWESFMRLE